VLLESFLNINIGLYLKLDLDLLQLRTFNINYTECVFKPVSKKKNCP
jgi:hypothetical protein